MSAPSSSRQSPPPETQSEAQIGGLGSGVLNEDHHDKKEGGKKGGKEDGKKGEDKGTEGLESNPEDEKEGK